MAAPKPARSEASTDHNIPINAQDGSCPETSVKPGDHVQWTAPSTSKAYVIPPPIFRACSGTITLAAGATGPSPACEVTGQPGSYGYTSGLGDPPAKSKETGDNDTIIIGTPMPSAGRY